MSRFCPPPWKPLRLPAVRACKVVIATGRIVGEAAQFAREIGASSAMITSGGAAISDPFNKKDVMEWTIPVETSAQIMEHLQGRPISAMIYVGEHLYMTSYSDSQFKLSRRVEGYWSSRVIEDDIAGLIRRENLGVCKIFARGEIPELADALCQFNCLPGIHITRSAEDNFEVMPAGVNKGRALRMLADLMGISMEQVIAIRRQRQRLGYAQGVRHAGRHGKRRRRRQKARALSDLRQRRGRRGTGDLSSVRLRFPAVKNCTALFRKR